MPYTRTPWSNLIPAGSRRAGDVDDAIRELRVDIAERMAALVVDWTTDPVVPLSGLSGAVTGAQLVFGPQILKGRDDQDDNVTIEYVQNDEENKSMYGQIVMPVGTVITLFEAWVDKNTAPSATVQLFSIVLATGVSTAVSAALSRSAVGIGVVTSAVLNKTIINTEFLMVRFLGTSPDGARCHGFRITYNRANSQQAY